MNESNPTLTVRKRKQMTQDILRAVAEDGSLIGPECPAGVRLLEQYGDVDGPFQGLSQVIDSLVAEGLLTPFISSTSGQPIAARARGITTKGLRELDKLDHPIRTYFEEHLSTWLIVGLTALIAGATIATAVMTGLVGGSNTGS